MFMSFCLRLVVEKVKNAVKEFNQATKDFFTGKLDALRPKIVELLENSKTKIGEWKELVVDGSKKIFVKLEESGVKIIADLKNGKMVPAVTNLRKLCN